MADKKDVIVGEIGIKVTEMLSPKKDEGRIPVALPAGFEFREDGKKVGTVCGGISGKVVIVEINDEDGHWIYTVSNEEIWQAVRDLHRKRTD